jgi:hypothetical protein
MIPERAKPVPLLKDDCVVYRSSLGPAGFLENVQVAVEITFGKTSVTNNEVIIDTLRSLIDLVEGIIDSAEQHVL